MGFLIFVLHLPSSASRPPVLLFTHPLTHHSLITHSLIHSLTHALTVHCNAFAWQAWDNIHCQGVGCTPWRFSTFWRACGVPLASLWHPFDVPLASLWCSLGFTAFAWQVRDNVLCPGVGCMHWRSFSVPLVSFLAPLLLCGRRATMCIAKGSLASLCCGVFWAPLLLCRRYAIIFIVKGSDVRPGVFLVSLWRVVGVFWKPLLLRGRRGSMCIAKGLDVCLGVALAFYLYSFGLPWAPLLLCGRRGTPLLTSRRPVLLFSSRPTYSLII